MAARPHIFRRGVLRCIRGSFGRFLALVGISALGCGFYAGLQMSGPDMRDSADRWYDGTQLWDLRVVSTLGFDENDLIRLAEIEGVEQVMPAKTCDVMVSLGGERIAARVCSLDMDAAQASKTATNYVVSSDDPAYLNRPMLREGRWPEAPNECVISADAVEDFTVGDTVEVLYGTDALDDQLQMQCFYVVGTVSSSDYPYTGSFGSTTLGSGQLDEYLYVREDAFVESFPYLEAYVRVAGAAAELADSDAYFAVTEQTQMRIEDRENALARARQNDLIDEAQATLDENQAEYEQERAKAELELADAAAELESSHAELLEGEDSYQQGRAAYHAGLSALATRRNEAELQLADGERQLEEGQVKLDAEAANLAASATQVEAARASIVAAETTCSTLEAQKAELCAALDSFDAAISQLEAALSQAQASGESTDELEARLQMTQENRSTAAEKLAQVEEGIALASSSEAQAQLAEARKAVAAYDAGVAALAQAQAELDASREELSRRRAEAERELTAAEDQLASAEARLAASRAQLDEGWAQWRSGKAEYEDARAAADQEFANAEHDLAEAQRRIDEIEPPDIYVLDHSQSEGAATYHADAGRIDAIADVFPLMFFLVAALVSLTTMTRMVEDDRIEIGTYKALGFSTATIASKYLAYAAFAATLGAVVGIGILTQVLPYIITSSYSIIYAVPLLAVPMPVDPHIALMAGGMGVGVTLIATWAAVVSSLRSTPAALMLPRAPKAGKRILLERVGPLWHRISFIGKVTLRNLFRYKRRLLMTVTGIAGCTALLLVGFGLHDAIWDIIDCQYGPIVHYDTTVGLDASSTVGNVAAVREAVEAAGGTGIQLVHQDNMQAGSQNYDGVLRVQVIIPEAIDSFDACISFKDRLTQRALPIGEDQVILTEKTALLLGLGIGDELQLFEVDAISNASGEPHVYTVTAIMENYVGNIVYLGNHVGADLLGAYSDSHPNVSQPDARAIYSTLYFSRAQDSDTAHLSEALHDLTGVSTVIFTDETIDTYRSMLSVIDLIVVVLIVSAALLALIVLYNLTNINISERIREIASLKVLGFTRSEVHAYIYRETALLSLFGDILGMVLGTWLAHFVVVTAEVDYVMFGRTIHFTSYVYAFILTLFFTALVLLLMRHKLDRIDMVDSLKSVD